MGYQQLYSPTGGVGQKLNRNNPKNDTTSNLGKNTHKIIQFNLNGFIRLSQKSIVTSHPALAEVGAVGHDQLIEYYNIGIGRKNNYNIEPPDASGDQTYPVKSSDASIYMDLYL